MKMYKNSTGTKNWKTPNDWHIPVMLSTQTGLDISLIYRCDVVPSKVDCVQFVNSKTTFSGMDQWTPAGYFIQWWKWIRLVAHEDS